MAFARYEQVIVDANGSVIPSVQVEVRREQVGQPLAVLYSDRDGTTPLGNPFTTGVDGIAAFHVRGGAFQITFTKVSASLSRVARYVGIGLASETDNVVVSLPSGEYDSMTAYAAGDFVTDQGGSWIAVQDAPAGNPPPTLPTAENSYWQLVASPGNDGAGVTGNALALQEIATPSTPGSNQHKLYWKSDARLYRLDDAGVERRVALGLPACFISGLQLANNVVDATNDIDVAAGACRDSADAEDIFATAMTKRLDANWAAGSGNGFRYSGASITNGTYHVYAVCKAGGADPDYYADPSASVATVLTHLQAETGGASYAYARRIGSILRESAAIVRFEQIGDTFKRAAVTEYASTAIAEALRTFFLPQGIVVRPILRVALYFNAAGNATIELGNGAGYTTLEAVLQQLGTASEEAYGNSIVDCYRTNTSAQINFRVQVLSGTLNTALVVNLGWIDRRGQDGGA